MLLGYGCNTTVLEDFCQGGLLQSTVVNFTNLDPNERGATLLFTSLTSIYSQSLWN